jgi:hypothetical protein
MEYLVLNRYPAWQTQRRSLRFALISAMTLHPVDRPLKQGRQFRQVRF